MMGNYVPLLRCSSGARCYCLALCRPNGCSMLSLFGTNFEKLFATKIPMHIFTHVYLSSRLVYSFNKHFLSASYLLSLCCRLISYTSTIIPGARRHHAPSTVFLSKSDFPLQELWCFVSLSWPYFYQFHTLVHF